VSEPWRASRPAHSIYLEKVTRRAWGCQRCVTALESAEHDAQSAEHGHEAGNSGANGLSCDTVVAVSAMFRVVEAHRERRR